MTPTCSPIARISQMDASLTPFCPKAAFQASVSIRSPRTAPRSLTVTLDAIVVDDDRAAERAHQSRYILMNLHLAPPEMYRGNGLPRVARSEWLSHMQHNAGHGSRGPAPHGDSSIGDQQSSGLGYQNRNKT